MKAALDVALFIVTVYEYFFGNNDPQLQPDTPNQLEDDYTNNTELLRDDFRKFNSASQAINYQKNQFFEEDDDEEAPGASIYTRLADDDLEKWKRENFSYSQNVKKGFQRFWNGTNNIMASYVKKRNNLNRDTIQHTEMLKSTQDFLAQKSESIHMRVSKYMYTRRAMKEVNSKFGNDFMTL